MIGETTTTTLRELADAARGAINAAVQCSLFIFMIPWLAGWLWTDALVSQHIRVDWSSSGEESKGNAALIA